MSWKHYFRALNEEGRTEGIFHSPKKARESSYPAIETVHICHSGKVKTFNGIVAHNSRLVQEAEGYSLGF